jgi:uncharacterized membrane protein YfcA
LKRAGARCTFPADESSLRAQPDLEHMPILNRGNRLMAVATSLATIMFTSISSVRAHHQRGAVSWHIVKVLAPAS